MLSWFEWDEGVKLIDLSKSMNRTRNNKKKREYKNSDLTMEKTKQKWDDFNFIIALHPLDTA